VQEIGKFVKTVAGVFLPEKVIFGSHREQRLQGRKDRQRPHKAKNGHSLAKGRSADLGKPQSGIVFVFVNPSALNCVVKLSVELL
jgi:hypothetical protein